MSGLEPMAASRNRTRGRSCHVTLQTLGPRQKLEAKDKGIHAKRNIATKSRS